MQPSFFFISCSLGNLPLFLRVLKDFSTDLLIAYSIQILSCLHSSFICAHSPNCTIRRDSAIVPAYFSVCYLGVRPAAELLVAARLLTAFDFLLNLINESQAPELVHPSKSVAAFFFLQQSSRRHFLPAAAASSIVHSLSTALTAVRLRYLGRTTY